MSPSALRRKLRQRKFAELLDEKLRRNYDIGYDYASRGGTIMVWIYAAT
jgi:hypothetical protein